MEQLQELARSGKNLLLGLVAVSLQYRQVCQQRQALCDGADAPDGSTVDRLTASIGMYTLFDSFYNQYHTLKNTEKTTASYCNLQQELWFSAIIVLISVIQFVKLFQSDNAVLADELVEESIDELII